LGSILSHGDIPYVMASVLDLPMPPPDLLQPLGIGFGWAQTGDSVVGFPTGHSFAGSGPFHATYLSQVRPVQVVIEGRSTPQLAFLLTVSVSTPLSGHPQFLTPGWFGEHQGNGGTEGGLVSLHYPEVVTTLLHYLTAQILLGIESIPSYQVSLEV